MFPFSLFKMFQFHATAFQDLNPAAFAEGLHRPDAVLLDVRRPDEFAQGHLPGAVNMDVTAPGFLERAAALDKNRPTYVYCRSGKRSAAAANELAGAGFAHLHNLLGGVLAWPNPLTNH